MAPLNSTLAKMSKRHIQMTDIEKFNLRRQRAATNSHHRSCYHLSCPPLSAALHYTWHLLPWHLQREHPYLELKISALALTKAPERKTSARESGRKITIHIGLITSSPSLTDRITEERHTESPFALLIQLEFRQPHLRRRFCRLCRPRRRHWCESSLRR